MDGFGCRSLPPGKYRIAVAPYRYGRVDYRRTIYYPAAAKTEDVQIFDVKIGEHMETIRFIVPD
jgi:hypothetical protein